LDREEVAKQVARIPDEQKAVFANILSEHSDVFSIDKEILANVTLYSNN
jgi:hypothetical protein